MTLLDILHRRFPDASNGTLKRMVEAGRVTIAGRRARMLKEGVGDAEPVEIAPKNGPAPPLAKPSSFVVVHEDADVLVVNKPPGLLTSTVPDEHRPTLLAKVREYVASREPAARVGLIHRLDRDASGLLVFSKTHAAYTSLKKQLFERTMQRVYLAVVDGVPRQPQGRIKTNLVELPDGSVRTSTTEDKGEPADTHYEVVKTRGKRALLRVTLHTGRKHQIRVHLSEHKLPIVGDKIYGKGKSDDRLMLCAMELGFTHPRSGERVKYVVEEAILLRAIEA